MPNLTKKAIDNCKSTPICSECQKYTLSYVEKHFWRCDDTCVIYCEQMKDQRFPVGYAELDYGDRNDAEAIDGMRFDDLNFLRHYER